MVLAVPVEGRSGRRAEGRLVLSMPVAHGAAGEVDRIEARRADHVAEQPAAVASVWEHIAAITWRGSGPLEGRRSGAADLRPDRADRR